VDHCKQDSKPKKGMDVLSRMRASEKEKLSNHKPTNTLGETAKWKVFSKAKYSQNSNIDQPKKITKISLKETTFEGSFKDVGNESELSLERSESSPKKAIEQQSLLSKIPLNQNKSTNIVPKDELSVISDEKITSKAGTPNFTSK
jgi:hypothetical protein